MIVVILRAQSRGVTLEFAYFGHGISMALTPHKSNLTGAPNIFSLFDTVLHAVNMAVLNRNASSLKDCTLYVTLYPDNDCAKSIIQSKMKSVVYWQQKKNHHPTEAAKRMLEWSKIPVRFASTNQSINHYYCCCCYYYYYFSFY